MKNYPFIVFFCWFCFYFELINLFYLFFEGGGQLRRQLRILSYSLSLGKPIKGRAKPMSSSKYIDLKYCIQLKNEQQINYQQLYGSI